MEHKKWHKRDVLFVQEQVNKLSDSEIAKCLGRSKKAIGRFRERFGIKRDQLFIKKLVDATRVSGGDMFAEKNPNWKGGISTNNYHYKLIQKNRHPQKIKARQIAETALRRGKITKKPCSVCGAINSQMHHKDYSKPLYVEFLCPEHHREVDRVKNNL